MAIKELCKILQNRRITDTHYDMRLSAPKIAALARPGQFAHILCGHSRMLRRPLSICAAQDGVLRIVYEVRGSGTEFLARRAAGKTLDVLGPLGCGTFPVLDDARPVLVAGGGIGVPPLLFAAEAQRCAHALLGFRTAQAVILREEFAQACEQVVITTDDGSFGEAGTIEAPMQRMLQAHAYSGVMACGPRPMLQTAARLAAAAGVPCWVSMEERMGCGVGACLVCACKTKHAEGERFSHVCKDGPVFPAEVVVW